MSSMQERRSEVRMMCADMVEVFWKDQQGKSRRAIGLLEDISASGACLQMEAPLPLGADVCWDSSSHKFTGRVRYCVYREIGYFVGVEMQAGSRWSKHAYEPRHLLDLRKLVMRAAR
jgi:PilZ domain